MRKLASASAMLLVVLATPVLANLSSRYALSGRGPDGTTYPGVIRFTADGQVYHLEEASGDNKWNGLAIENGNFLGLAGVGGDRNGFLALYTRAGDSWEGTDTDYGADDPVAFEVLYNGNAPDLPDPSRANSRKPLGKYRISGTNPDGSTYAGEVEIKSNKHFFEVDRTAGKDEMTGTGLAFDNAFIVNVNNDSQKRAPIGVLGLFTPDGNGFVGFWAKTGSPKLGAERWTRE
jgi:hypothetical protein